MQGERCKCYGVVYVSSVSAVVCAKRAMEVLWRGVYERCKCCVDRDVVYLSTSAVVCAPLQFFDE